MISYQTNNSCHHAWQPMASMYECVLNKICSVKALSGWKTREVLYEYSCSETKLTVAVSSDNLHQHTLHRIELSNSLAPLSCTDHTHTLFLQVFFFICNITHFHTCMLSISCVDPRHTHKSFWCAPRHLHAHTHDLLQFKLIV